LPNITLKDASDTDMNVVNLNSYTTNSTEKWQQILIPLSQFAQKIDIKDISGVKFSQGESCDQLMELYIDQIELVSKKDKLSITQNPELISAKGYERHIDVSWKPVLDSAVRYVQILRSSDANQNYKVVGIQSSRISGYSDFVESNDSKEWY